MTNQEEARTKPPEYEHKVHIIKHYAHTVFLKFGYSYLISIFLFELFILFPEKFPIHHKTWNSLWVRELSRIYKSPLYFETNSSFPFNDPWISNSPKSPWTGRSHFLDAEPQVSSLGLFLTPNSFLMNLPQVIECTFCCLWSSSNKKASPKMSCCFSYSTPQPSDVTNLSYSLFPSSSAFRFCFTIFYFCSSLEKWHLQNLILRFKLFWSK